MARIDKNGILKYKTTLWGVTKKNSNFYHNFFAQNLQKSGDILGSLIILTHPVKEENFCQPQYFDRNSTIPCNEFIYDNTFFDETLSTKLDLVCVKESYRSLLGTILILGLLFGSLFGGRVGDQFGRKKAFFFAASLMSVLLIGAGFVNSYAREYEIKYDYQSTYNSQVTDFLTAFCLLQSNHVLQILHECCSPNLKVSFDSFWVQIGWNKFEEKK